MKIALCQFDQVWEDAQANRQKIQTMVEATTESFDWLVFPEMSLSAFTMDRDKSTLQEEDFAFFSQLARERRSWVSFGGARGNENHLVTMDREGQIVSSYAKIHLYSFGGEDKHYQPGSRRERFQMETIAAQPAICFDLRFPQLFWDGAMKTQLYVVIASWPARRSEHWMSLLRARAIENQAYVVGVNRCGRDPFLEYSGNSLIYDPLGKTVLDCGDREGIHVAQTTVDPELVERTRQRFPFLQDRKPIPAWEEE